MTSYGRKFEAGNVKYMSYEASNVFSADKSFLAGFFGRQKDVIISLGFILYKKFTHESFEALKWPDYNEMQLKTKDIIGETDKVCNDTGKPKIQSLFYPSTQGEYRCIWLDHPFQDIKNVKFSTAISIPSADKQGRKTLEPLKDLTFPNDIRSFHFTRMPHILTLKHGQCAKLKY